MGGCGRACPPRTGDGRLAYGRWRTPRSPTASTLSRHCSSSRDANPYTARAYRRAAETIRAAPSPVAELVRSGRVRELRGIGPGIEARLRELVETGEIAELAELERELAPDLVGLGRYLGLSAKRSVEIARALGVRTPDELRAAAAAGRLRTRAGHRPEDRGAAARGARPRGRAAAAARAAAQPGLGARRRRRGRPRRRGGRRRAAMARLLRAPGGRLRRRRSGAGARPASPRCPRSSRWSSRRSGARSA